jgi:SAM-dependent methyltransferase
MHRREPRAVSHTIDARRHAPAAERNAEPIRSVLERVLPAGGVVLEIASGTGQHAVHMARALRGITWQPTDVDPDALASIAAHVADAALPNLRAPVQLDVAEEPWPIAPVDAVVCINLLHVAPWSAALALLRGAVGVLSAGGVLYTYGPYRFQGRCAPSNEAFDASLRARDPSWGVRDVSDLEAAAAQVGLRLHEVVPMPANNHSLIFRP